jgi:hypothetical protein
MKDPKPEQANYSSDDSLFQGLANNHQGVEAQSSQKEKRLQSEEHDRGGRETSSSHGHQNLCKRTSPDAMHDLHIETKSRNDLDDFPCNERITLTLCHYCKEVIPHIFDEMKLLDNEWASSEFDHCANFLELEEMAAAGCSFCTLFLWNLP